MHNTNKTRKIDAENEQASKQANKWREEKRSDNEWEQIPNILFDKVQHVCVCVCMWVTEMSKETKYANLHGSKRPCVSVHRSRSSYTAHNIMNTGLIIMMTMIWHFVFLFQAKSGKCCLKKATCTCIQAHVHSLIHTHTHTHRKFKTIWIREFYRCSWWNMSTLNDCIPSFSTFLSFLMPSTPRWRFLSIICALASAATERSKNSTQTSFTVQQQQQQKSSSNSRKRRRKKPNINYI